MKYEITWRCFIETTHNTCNKGQSTSEHIIYSSDPNYSATVKVIVKRLQDMHESGPMEKEYTGRSEVIGFLPISLVVVGKI